MDKIAVISDIHGNLPALETVLADIKARGIETIYCLGDLAGKGPSGADCVDLVREVCTATVKGNWDALLASDDKPFNDAIHWYRNELGTERRHYLDTLPHTIDFKLSGRQVRLYHASSDSIFHRVYPWDDQPTLTAMFANTDFTGYDHPAPDIVGYGDIHTAFMQTLHDEPKIIFNANSTGNPLDIPLATYVILSGEANSNTPAPFSIDFIRLPYDIERAVLDAIDAGMPDVEPYALEVRSAIYRGRKTS